MFSRCPMGVSSSVSPQLTPHPSLFAKYLLCFSLDGVESIQAPGGIQTPVCFILLYPISQTQQIFFFSFKIFFVSPLLFYCMFSGLGFHSLPSGLAKGTSCSFPGKQLLLLSTSIAAACHPSFSSGCLATLTPSLRLSSGILFSRALS